MRIPRIYQAGALAVGELLSLDSQASHHLARVLRLKIGDSLIVFNGEGGEYAAVIRQLERRSAQIEIQAQQAISLESPLELVLVQGISRGERMDYTIQKAVELGVTRIEPVITARTVVNVRGERQEKRLAHWQAVVNSACEQCGRNRVPPVMPVQTLSQWLDYHENTDNASGVHRGLRLVLHHRAHASLTSYTKPSGPVTLLIGPEGGLSEAEITAASLNAFQPLRLGPRILRTETAAVAALSVLQWQWGDFQSVD